MTARSRFEAWCDGALVARRDRCVDRIVGWWEYALRSRRYRLEDRVAAWWEYAVQDRRYRLEDRVAAWWKGRPRRSHRRAGREVPLGLALGLALVAAAVGSFVAIAGPWGHRAPDRATSAGPAAVRHVARNGDLLAVRLGAVVESLRVERSKARERLADSRTAKRQGAVASTLADAYRFGAAKLATVTGREQAGIAVGAAMRAAAAAYDALAIAAVEGDGRRFAAARGRVARTEDAVRFTLARVTERAS